MSKNVVHRVAVIGTRRAWEDFCAGLKPEDGGTYVHVPTARHARGYEFSDVQRICPWEFDRELDEAEACARGRVKLPVEPIEDSAP